MSTEPTRVVALGASNLTRGLPSVVSAARAAWGSDVEVLAALGLGRSYGAASRVAFRTLPGILQSGLWAQLEARAPQPTRGLVTDVGNDILYGFSAEQTLAWVGEALHRLNRLTHDLVLTDLPLASIRRLSPSKFLVFRSLLVPSCRLSLDEVRATSERVSEGLARLAAKHGARFVPQEGEWYGLDPVHIRPRLWSHVWPEILGAPARRGRARSSTAERLRLYTMPPERQWLFGRERATPQSGVALRAGGRVWLY